MFRSEDMTLNKLMFTKESMWETINYLAKTERVMINPLKMSQKNSKNPITVFASNKIKKNENLNFFVQCWQFQTAYSLDRPQDDSKLCNCLKTETART